MEIEEKLKDPKYAKAYSEKELWDKVLKYAKLAGIELIYLVLILFYVLQQPSTPKWAKSLIIGALGYFILPIDAVPDFIPGIGQLDDWALLVAALGAVAVYVTEESKSKAKERLHIWFGDYDAEKLEKVESKIKSEDVEK
jgi:uncharacterized membrane protein YkvA (DUF1232 family)